MSCLIHSGVVMLRLQYMLNDFCFGPVTLHSHVICYSDNDFLVRVHHIHSVMKQTPCLFLPIGCWVLILWDCQHRSHVRVLYFGTRSYCFDHHSRHVAEMGCRVRIRACYSDFIWCLNDCHWNVKDFCHVLDVHWDIIKSWIHVVLDDYHLSDS